MGFRAVGRRFYWCSFALSDFSNFSGKSTVTIRFVKNVFIETYNPTVENTYNTVIEYKGEKFNAEIVDTAGQVSCFFFFRHSFG